MKKNKTKQQKKKPAAARKEKKPEKIVAYKIDAGVPVPAPANRPGNGKASKATATLALLSAGDSFLVKDPYDGTRAEKNMRDLMSREIKNKGSRLFVSRRVKNGIRIWRVK